MAVGAVIPLMFVAVSQFCDVPVKILYAVAQVESGARNFAMNVDGKGSFFDTRDELYEAAMTAISNGKRPDLGIAQINFYWHSDHTDSLWQLTDPAQNLLVSCKILKRHYDKHGDWLTATGYYHREAGRPKDFRARKYYMGKVKTALENL